MSIRAKTRSTSGWWPSFNATRFPSKRPSKAVTDPTIEDARLPNANNAMIHVRRDERPQGVVAYLTLDDGRGLNVIGSAAMDALTKALGTLASDDDLRVVVLSGAGKRAFSVGADIKEMAAIDNPAGARALITRLHRTADAIRGLPVPVIGKIHGFCFGAGMEIAVACDVRFAADNASFGMPEVKIGIPSVIEAALFPLLAGFGRAREVLMLGEAFSASEALTWRLIEHVVPASNLDQAVEDWIAKLLTSAPRAVRLQKRLIRQWEDLPVSDAVAAGIDAFAAAYETDEPRVTMRKFLAAQKARKAGS
jgi:enoyl-CoA hydratase